MNKIWISLILLFSLTLPAAAQEGEGIRFFHGTWEEALQKAKQENKMIFVDCYTVWCGPCAYMAKNVFTLKEVGDFFNEHFVNVQVDMEKGEGRDLAKRFNVTAYPTLLILDNEGNLRHRITGTRSPREFVDLLVKTCRSHGCFFARRRGCGAFFLFFCALGRKPFASRRNLHYNINGGPVCPPIFPREVFE